MIKSYLGVLGGTSGDFPWVQGEFLAPTVAELKDAAGGPEMTASAGWLC